MGYCNPGSPFAALVIRSGPTITSRSLYILLAITSLRSAPRRFTVGQPPSSLIRLVSLFLPASTKIWVRSSTSGMRRDEVSMSRLSFSHLHNCSSSSPDLRASSAAGRMLPCRGYGQNGPGLSCVRLLWRVNRIGMPVKLRREIGRGRRQAVRPGWIARKADK